MYAFLVLKLQFRMSLFYADNMEYYTVHSGEWVHNRYEEGMWPLTLIGMCDCRSSGAIGSRAVFIRLYRLSNAEVVGLSPHWSSVAYYLHLKEWHHTFKELRSVFRQDVIVHTKVAAIMNCCIQQRTVAFVDVFIYTYANGTMYFVSSCKMLWNYFTF